MHLHNLSKNSEWRWPSNTTGSNISESISRVADRELGNRNTIGRQEMVERNNSHRQMLQEKDSHDQRRYKTKITQKRLDQLTRQFPYDHGYRNTKKTVSLGVNQISIEDVMKLNNQTKRGATTWELHFGNGNNDTKGDSVKDHSYGGNRSRTDDDVLGMDRNERHTIAKMNEFEYEGKMRYDDDEPNYKEKSHVPVPRSPVKQVQRVLVEDYIPKRNFGDYDPVRSQHIPSSGEIKTSLPFKLDKRRVLYKGISSEEDIKIRRKREEKMQQESDWRSELNRSYDQNIGKYRSSENDNEYRGATSYSEYQKSDSRSALNSRKEIVSSEEEVDDHSEDGYAQRYQVPDVSFRSEEIIEAETRYKRHYTMSEKEGQDTYRGSYPGWKLPSHAQDLQRVQLNASTSDTYDRRPALASSSSAQNQPSSSWMDYTKGTGFFLPSGDPKIGEKNPGTSPVNEGYVTKEGNVDVRSYDSRFELGRNESQFADEIYKLDYFYRLQRRQTEEKHGIEYFGFLLEFWPKDAPDLTEVVFGYQMTDEAQAQDSVFAAGLMRLKNTYKKNEEAIRLRKIEKAKARGYLYRQNPIFSALGPGSAFGLTSVKSNQLATEIENEDNHQRISTSLDADRYSTDEEAERKGYVTALQESRTHLTERKGNSSAPEEVRRYFTQPKDSSTAPKEARRHTTERKSSTYYPEEKETDSSYESYGPKKTEAIVKDKDDGNFRIAIPRGPSIIWDTRRGGNPQGRNRESNRSGLGYQGRK